MSAHKPMHFPPTREEVMGAAQAFAPAMGMRYAKERNRVVPGHPFVSCLAPALRVRLMLEDELIQIALHEHGSLHKCEKFVQEVHWRSYWRSWLELHSTIWTRYLRSRDGAQTSLTPEQRERIAQIEAGHSGCEPMDNFARELVETGYLHNHARMWFAAYWVHSEKLPWELGSDFFERHLICACPASNTLSWRWVAGLQTRGKTYLARRSNLEEYCDAAYLGHENGMEQLEKPTAVHISEAPVPSPIRPTFDAAPENQSGLGLWITEDDLAPETSEELASLDFAAICTSVIGAPHTSPASNGLRRSYRLRAAGDAGKRAQEKWGVDSSTLEANNSAELARQLGEWVETSGIKTLVALKPFVGPSNDALEDIRAQLAQQKIELRLLRRPEDAQLFPYASGGFFKFWQRVKSEVLGE